MAIPVARTFTALETPSAADYNAGVRDPIRFAVNQPGAVVRRVAAATFTNGSHQLVPWDVEYFDNRSMVDLAANNTRILVTESGLYDIHGYILWSSNSTGVRMATIRINGVDQNLGTPNAIPTAVGNTGALALLTAFLNVNDSIQLAGYQSSGGNLATSTYAPSYLSVCRRTG